MKKTGIKFSFLKKKKVLLVLLAAVLVLGAVGVVLGRRNRFNQPAQSMSYIRTTTLSSGSITQSVSATGSVESANVSNVTTSLSYIVKSIEVQEGDVVEAKDVIVLAVLFSMTIGIFFGSYPANKAAKMNPIDALRYE